MTYRWGDDGEPWISSTLSSMTSSAGDFFVSKASFPLSLEFITLVGLLKVKETGNNFYMWDDSLYSIRFNSFEV